jgi:hypothetical protein
MPIMIILSVVTIAVPGLFGYNVRQLREGDALPVPQHEPI